MDVVSPNSNQPDSPGPAMTLPHGSSVYTRQANGTSSESKSGSSLHSASATIFSSANDQPSIVLDAAFPSTWGFYISLTSTLWTLWLIARTVAGGVVFRLLNILPTVTYGRLSDGNAMTVISSQAVLDDDGQGKTLCLDTLDPVATLAQRRDALLSARDKTEVDLVPFVFQLADSLQSRFERQGQVDDLDEQITLYTEALEHLTQGDPRQELARGRLGNAFRARCLVRGKSSDVQNAISFLTDALQLCPEEHSSYPRRLNDVGSAFRLLCRQQSGFLDEHLTKSIYLHEKALALCPNGHRDRQESLFHLGTALLIQSTHSGQQSDLEDAIRYLRESVDSSTIGTINREKRLNNLAAALNLRHSQLGDIADLDEGIEAFKETLTIRVPGHPLRFRSIGNLGNSYKARFLLSDAIDDLNTCITYAQQALELCDAEHPDRPLWLNMLGDSLHYKFEKLGNIEDLHMAHEIASGLIQQLPPDHHSSGCNAHNLGNCCRTLFRVSGDQRYLDEAIEMFQRARSSKDYPRIQHSQGPIVIVALGNVYRNRFIFSGDHADLEEAVSLHRESLDLEKNRELGRCFAFTNLADTLLTRFEDSKALEDLQEAISLLQQVAVVGRQGGTIRRHAIPSLADALLMRGRITRDVADLLQAAQMVADGMTINAGNYPLRYKLLRTSAGIHFVRFQLFGEDADLSSTIQILRDTLNFGSVGHADRHLVLSELTRALATRFSRAEALEDFDEAWGLQQDTINLVPTGHAGRSKCLMQMSELRLLPGTPAFDPPAAIELLREAVTDKYCNAQHRLTGSGNVLDTAERLISQRAPSEKSLREALLGVYLEMVRLLPRVAYFGMDVRSRLRALGEGASFAMDGAAHAAQLGLYEVALQMLEEGRGIFWAQALRLRSPFAGLPDHLRVKLIELSHQLEQDSYVVRSAAHEQATKVAQDLELARRRRQSEDFDHLLLQVRELPGFERFLLPQVSSSLIQVAAKGPVVVLVASKVSCEALLIRPGGSADRVSLDGVTFARVQWIGNRLSECLQYSKALRDGDRAMVQKEPKGLEVDDLLKELWDAVVSPIIQALGLQKSAGRSRPRLWWCPTGPFAFLPVHAAGVAHGTGSACSDFVVSSYIPNLGALLKMREESHPLPRSEAKMLVAAVRRPFKGSDLPCTVTEISAVQNVVPPEAIIPLPAAEDVLAAGTDSAGLCAATLLEHLPQATILHLACHGLQDAKDPLESGFLMADDILTVAKLLPIPLPRAFLAILSACETAKGDRSQPDQAIHLAAAMLFAGFKSVVATMWSMNDIDGPMVAQTIYEELFRSDSQLLDADAIPYALDDAVQKLRADRLHPSRWATYVHFGM